MESNAILKNPEQEINAHWMDPTEDVPDCHKCESSNSVQTKKQVITAPPFFAIEIRDDHDKNLIYNDVCQFFGFPYELIGVVIISPGHFTAYARFSTFLWDEKVTGWYYYNDMPDGRAQHVKYIDRTKQPVMLMYKKINEE